MSKCCDIGVLTHVAQTSKLHCTNLRLALLSAPNTPSRNGNDSIQSINKDSKNAVKKLAMPARLGCLSTDPIAPVQMTPLKPSILARLMQPPKH